MTVAWRAWACSLSLVTVAAAAVTGLTLGLTLGRDAGPLIADQRACAPGWSGPSAGRQRINVRDTSADVAQIYLVDSQNRVYAEARDVDPGTSATLSVTLGPGRYALRCVFSNGVTRTSASGAVPHGRGSAGAGTAVAGMAPMPDLDLEQAVRDYRAYVAASLPRLVADTRSLDDAVASGDLAAARAAWLTAHLDYERLGAAYNSFGDFDAALNSDLEGLPAGAADPSWTGFFRLECGLWHGAAIATLKPVARQLLTDVRGLRDDFPSQDLDPADLPLRAHEILENALQFQLDGADDFGSGTTLATTYANTEGTLAVLGVLAPLIAPRDPPLLASARAQIAALQADLLSCRAGGAWIAAASLSRPQRQRLDADLGALLETLAAVPNLLMERNSA